MKILPEDHEKFAMRLADFFCRRLRIRDSERELFENDARYALWKACETFEEGHGASFQTYATMLIRRRMHNAYCTTYGRSETKRKQRFRQCQTNVIFDRAKEAGTDHVANAEMVAKYLPLAGNSETVLRELYLENKGQTELARIKGVSAARISKLHTDGINQIREALGLERWARGELAKQVTWSRPGKRR